jgi:Zn-dependent oligopeptidase
MQPPATYNESELYYTQRTKILAKKEELETVNDDATQDIERIVKRLDMLDRRLDNVDSIVSAVAERVMQQPITFNVTCSKCGQKIEIAIIGTEKPSR